jgi:hypothetical protein
MLDGLPDVLPSPSDDAVLYGAYGWYGAAPEPTSMPLVRWTACRLCCLRSATTLRARACSAGWWIQPGRRREFRAAEAELLRAQAAEAELLRAQAAEAELLRAQAAEAELLRAQAAEAGLLRAQRRSAAAAAARCATAQPGRGRPVTKVVLATAGPFGLYGDPVVDAYVR